MRISIKFAGFVVLLSALSMRPFAFAQGTAFTYQGQLGAAGGPAGGTFDLTFALYDSLTLGTQQGNTITNNATPISNGLFTVTLDFGPGIFTGAGRWLQIGVRTNGGGAFAPLTPRQQVTSTPYAIQAANAATATSAASAASVAATNITGMLTPAQLPASVLTNGASGVSISGTFSGSFAGNGAGVTNVPGTMPWQTVPGTSLTAAANQAYLLTNNSTTTVGLPTTANVGDLVTVSGTGSNGWQLQVLPASGQSVLGYPAPGQVWTTNNNAPVTDWQSVASSAGRRFLS
jgi:hypothetical protein